MPTSITPPPRENEVECANCGAHVYIELTRCPDCGVNLYEPEDEIVEEYQGSDSASGEGILGKIGDLWQRVTGKPYSAEEVFGDALNQANLYQDLLNKVGGDHGVVERLIAYESDRMPEANRFKWLQAAIQRWERDNMTPGTLGN